MRRLLTLTTALCATAFTPGLAQPPEFSTVVEQAIVAPTSLQRARLDLTQAYARLPSDDARTQARLDLLRNRLSDAEDIARRRETLLGGMPGMDRFRALRGEVSDAAQGVGIPFPDLDPEPLARLGRLAELRAQVALQQGLARSIGDVDGKFLDEQRSMAVLSVLVTVRTPADAGPILDRLTKDAIVLAQVDRDRLSKAVADRVGLYRDAKESLEQARAKMAARARATQQAFADAVQPVQAALATNHQRLETAADALNAAWSRLQSTPPGQVASAEQAYAQAYADHANLAEQARLGGEFIRQALLGSGVGERVVTVTNAVGDVADTVRVATVAVENAHADLKLQVSAYAGAIGQIGKTMQHIGLLSDAAASVIATGIGVAETAASVIGSVASGNFIGAAMSVVGFLGGSLFGGGPSQEQIWHQEIMAGQRQILSGINEIIQGQQAIAQGVQELLQGQQQILEALAGIADQIDQNQHALMTKLDAVEERLIDVQFLLSNALLNDLRACTVIDDQLGAIRDLGALRKEIGNPASIPSDTINHCANGIRNHLQNLDVTTPGVPILPIYLLQANPSPGASEVAALQYEARMRQVFSFLEQNTNITQRAGVLRKLFTPSARVQDLRDADDTPPAYALHISLGAPLSDQAVLLAARAALDVHWLFELLAPGIQILDVLQPPPDYSPISSPGSAADGFSKYPGLHALQKALPLVELTMAQQTLLSGDALLFRVDAAILGSDDRRQAALDLLRQNPVMARNFVLFTLRQHKNGETDFRAYDFALRHTDDPGYLNAFAPRPAGQSYRYGKQAVPLQADCPAGTPAVPSSWSMTIDRCLSVPLPSIERFRSGTLEFTAPFLQLLDVYTRLIGAQATYAWTPLGGPLVGGSKDMAQRVREYAVLSILF